MRVKHVEKGCPVTLQLGLSDTVQGQQFLGRRGLHAHHFAERRVVEDDIGRHVGFGGEFLAAGPQRFPERQVLRPGVVVGLPRDLGGPFGGGVFAQQDPLFAPQQRPRFPREGEGAEALGLGAEVALHEQLAHDRTPLRVGEILADSVGAQPVVAPGEDLLGLLAAQDVDHVSGAEALARAVDAGEQFLGLGGAVPGAGRVQADVAVAAVFRQVVTEVLEQGAAPALGDLAPPEQGVEPRPFDPLALGVGFRLLDHLGEADDILEAVHHPGVRRFAVAAGPAGLLVVGLHALRKIDVRDEAHVRLVDAHAEGDRRHDDDAVFPEEALLVPRPDVRRQSRVVGERVEPPLGEHPCGVLDLPAGHRVDDPRAPAPGFEEGDELAAGVGLRLHGVPDVRSVEPAHETGRAGQPQPPEDLLARTGVGRGREGDAWHAGEALAEDMQSQVVLPEVVPPLGHAMRLVDGDEGEPHGVEQFQGLFLEQALRSQVQEVELPRREVADHLGLIARRERRIQEARAHAELAQRRDLVLHQRDERRHHDADAVPQQRRQLVAEGLPAARRHQHQGVAAFRHRADDVFLPAPEPGVSVHRAQQLASAFDHGATIRRGIPPPHRKSPTFAVRRRPPRARNGSESSTRTVP